MFSDCVLYSTVSVGINVLKREESFIVFIISSLGLVFEPLL